MSREHRCVADLGPVRVAVATDHDGLVDYLHDFYSLEPSTDHDGIAGWTIQARLTEPETGMALTPWRVGYRADQDTRRAVICSTDPRDLAITVRKAIREVLLDYCEAREYTMLHASAVADEARVVIVVGDKGSGKTTLALGAALGSGYRYLSNDHLILYRTRRAGGDVVADADPGQDRHLLRLRGPARSAVGERGCRHQGVSADATPAALRPRCPAALHLLRSRAGQPPAHRVGRPPGCGGAGRLRPR